MAVDAAVMVIDSAKGIEAQLRIVEVVKHRGIRLHCYDKLDRDGREPLDLLEELEDILGIASYPMNWPIGMGRALKVFMTSTMSGWSFIRARRFATLAEGDQLFASNPFYEQLGRY